MSLRVFCVPLRVSVRLYVCVSLCVCVCVSVCVCVFRDCIAVVRFRWLCFATYSGQGGPTRGGRIVLREANVLCIVLLL